MILGGGGKHVGGKGAGLQTLAEGDDVDCGQGPGEKSGCRGD